MDNATYTKLPIANDRPMYGVWIPSKGWLRAKDVFVDYDLVKVKEVAKRFRRKKATVYYIDQSLIDMEDKLLEAEKENKFALTFITFIMKSLKMATK